MSNAKHSVDLAADEIQPTEPSEAIQKEIDRLGLQSYIDELDEKGFTVLPPEIASPNHLADRLLEGVLDVAEKRSGVRPNVDDGATHAGFESKYGGESPWGEMLRILTLEGPVFEEALMNPVLLAMTTYMLGYSMVVSSYSALVKGKGDTCFNFHSDTLLPAPWPDHALVCNGSYVLTDYNRENGSIAFVPGSHKLGRGPVNGEEVVGEGGNPDAIAVEAPRGSLIVWHGKTWHGAYNRQTEGLRIVIPILFARPYMRTEEDLMGHVPQETLDRNPWRFRVLTQHGISYGWSSNDDALQRGATADETLAQYYEEMNGAPKLNPMDYASDLING